MFYIKKNILIIFYINAFFYGCVEKQKSSVTEQQPDSSAIHTISTLTDTNQYLYDFLKMVLADQKLQYSYGLSQEVKNCLYVESDEVYL